MNCRYAWVGGNFFFSQPGMGQASTLTNLSCPQYHLSANKQVELLAVTKNNLGTAAGTFFSWCVLIKFASAFAWFVLFSFSVHSKLQACLTHRKASMCKYFGLQVHAIEYPGMHLRHFSSSVRSKISLLHRVLSPPTRVLALLCFGSPQGTS